MDFELTEEHRMFQKFIRDFAEKEIAPLVDEAEETNVFPQQLFKQMGDIGFLCPRYPEALGGGGGDKITEIIMAEELNKVNAGIASSLMVQGGLSTQPIYHFGSEEQKQRILVPAIKGEKIAAMGKDLTRDQGNGARVIDARSRYVLPGGVDVHVHLDLPFCGTVSSDDFDSGTRAAARGGGSAAPGDGLHLAELEHAPLAVLAADGDK